MQSECAERFLLFIVSCRRPVELEVLLELGVERARRDGLEEATGRLVLHFYLLALHLFRRVLLLDEARSSVRARAWHRRWLHYLRIQGRKLALSRPESTNIGLPLFGCERLLLCRCRVVLRSWVGVAAEQEVLPVGCEAGSVGPARALRQEGTLAYLVGTWAHGRVLAVVEVVFFDFGIGCPEELEVVLLLLLPKIAQLEYVLVRSRLHFVRHVLLAKDVLLLLGGIVALCLGRYLLDQLLVAVLASILVLQHRLLVQHAFHHFHADGELLLVVFAWSRIVDDLLVGGWAMCLLADCLRDAPGVGGRLLSGSFEFGLVLTWANVSLLLADLCWLPASCTLLASDLQLCEVALVSASAIFGIKVLSAFRLHDWCSLDSAI